MLKKDNWEIRVLQEQDAQAAKAAYGFDPSAAIYGMDQFISEPDYWNRGLGTQLVSILLTHIAQAYQAKSIVLDPQAWNERAIRCYEKCGFRKRRLLPVHEWHEGSMRDCWLMEWSPSAHRS